MRETTVKQVMPYWPGKQLHSDDFSELWVKIGKNPDAYTLEELNKFRDKHSATIKLSAVLSSLKSLLPGQSFFTVWYIPTVAVKDVMEEIGRIHHELYIVEHVQMIVLENKLLYLSDSTHKVHIHINYSLIPRPSLPALNVARKKQEEGLVCDVTLYMSLFNERGRGLPQTYKSPTST